jgi:hypothetical protein
MNDWEDIDSGWEDVSAPSISKKEIDSAAAEALSQKEPTWWESITTPTTPEETSYGRIGASGLAGMGIGFALPVPGGALGGGIAGLASGVAGEISRAYGNRPITTFGVEMLGGELPMAIKKLGGFAINKLFMNSDLGLVLNKSLKNFSEEDKIILKAKEKLFGKNTFDGMYTTKNSDQAQALLKDQYGLVGSSEKKASDLYREKLYSDIDDVAKGLIDEVQTIPGQPSPYTGVTGVKSPDVQVTLKKPNTFINSAEGKSFMDEVNLLKERKLISPKEYANLKKILENQNSPNPKLRDSAKTDILNLIQNGGQYTVGNEVKQLISTDAQKVLKSYFGDYLERYANTNTYKVLKEIEQQEFIAAARDSIPTMVFSRFKYSDKQFQAALDNIAKSPQGKVEFANAITQHFRNFGKTVSVKGKQVGNNISPDDMISEFNRLRPAIEKSGVLDRQSIIDITKKIQQLPKQVSVEKRKQVIADLIKDGLTGVIAGEAPIRAEQGFNFTIPTL